MTNVDKLREGLTNYLEALRQHLAAVQDQSEETEASFQQLMNVQEGAAAETYQSKWQPASAWVQDYVSETTQLAALLEERIQELEQIR